MAKIIFYTLFLLTCQFQVQAQFMVDTLSPVEITSKKNIKRVSFSTFTSKISLSGSHFGYTTTEQDTSVEERVIPVAIQVQNKKGDIVRLDSMLIKSTFFDTTKTTITLNIYATGKRYKSSRIILMKTDGKASTVYFASPVYLPPDTSYIGFTVTTRDNFSFSFYTNKKIQGYLYSYNQAHDEFRLLHYKDMPRVTCPQIQLYYTKIP